MTASISPERSKKMFSMTLKNVGKGSQYAFTYLDSNSNPLDGNVPANVPAKDFWSFTLYDNQTRSMLQTDSQFPAIGSNDESVVQKKMDPTISTSLLKRLAPVVRNKTDPIREHLTMLLFGEGKRSNPAN